GTSPVRRGGRGGGGYYQLGCLKKGRSWRGGLPRAVGPEAGKDFSRPRRLLHFGKKIYSPQGLPGVVGLLYSFSANGAFGLTRKATSVAVGTTSCSNSNCFGARVLVRRRAASGAVRCMGLKARLGLL